MAIYSQLSNLENLGVLATVLGVFAAVREFFANLMNRRKQVLRSLEHQLNNSKHWTGPYEGHPSDDENLVFVEPWKIVYDIEATALQEITTQEGLLDFPKSLIEKLTQYNQHLARMRNVESFRENLVGNNIDLAYIIKEKINQEKQNKPRSYSRFVSSFDLQNVDEKKAKFLAEELHHLMNVFHYDIIGGASADGLHSTHNGLMQEIGRGRKKLVRTELAYRVLETLGLFIIFLTIFAFIEASPKDLCGMVNIMLLSVVIRSVPLAIQYIRGLE